MSSVPCPAFTFTNVPNLPACDAQLPTTRTPYRLYTARLDLHVSILVYPASSRVVPALPHVEAAKDDAAGQAAAPYSLAVGSGVVVPLSEAAPLQVTWCLRHAKSVAFAIAKDACCLSPELCEQCRETYKIDANGEDVQ